MANRPVFFSEPCGEWLVRTKMIDFKWHPGMSMVQRQKSVTSLHSALRSIYPDVSVLEVSRMSDEGLGEQLSAFNLSFLPHGLSKRVTVECAFQASKVFERGGPYEDLLDVRPSDAKRDPRLTESGRLIGFRYFGEAWPLVPLTAFYDWLYINALHQQHDLTKDLMIYEAFTDIAFNPEKSINCQAAAVSLYVSLSKTGRINDVLTSRKYFLTMEENAYLREVSEQGSLF